MSAARAVHLSSHRYHDDESENTDVAVRVLFLLVSYLFLLTFVYFFLKKCIRVQT
jgi:hypothetical protein